MSTKASREPRETRGTKMKTEANAHSSAIIPPSSSSSTSTSTGATSSTLHTARIASTVRVRRCGVPTHSSCSATQPTRWPVRFCAACAARACFRFRVSIVTTTCACSISGSPSSMVASDVSASSWWSSSASA